MSSKTNTTSESKSGHEPDECCDPCKADQEKVESISVWAKFDDVYKGIDQIDDMREVEAEIVELMTTQILKDIERDQNKAFFGRSVTNDELDEDQAAVIKALETMVKKEQNAYPSFMDGLTKMFGNT